MKITLTKREANKLELFFELLPHQPSPVREEYNLGNIAIYFRFDAQEENYVIYVLFLDRTKPAYKDTLRACKVFSTSAKLTPKRFVCDDSGWRVLFKHYQDEYKPYSFDLTLESDIIMMKNPFAVLYDDETMTDFELCAEDGSVKFHSAILATSSLTLRRMLMGRWAETESRTLQVKDTTKSTIQHLKDYLYTSKLPDSGVEQLLLLASYYMITDLENKCIEKLIHEVTTETSTDLARFAFSNNLMKLYYSYLELVRDQIINVTILQDKESQSEIRLLDD